jgi:hypothetical protein
MVNMLHSTRDGSFLYSSGLLNYGLTDVELCLPFSISRAAGAKNEAWAIGPYFVFPTATSRDLDFQPASRYFDHMLVNWYARKNSNKVTFPIGLNISKVVRIGPLPVKFAVQGQYMPVHPDVFGQTWNLQFAVTQVIPNLIRGNLFDF